jgi:hypothetical protein
MQNRGLTLSSVLWFLTTIAPSSLRLPSDKCAKLKPLWLFTREPWIVLCTNPYGYYISKVPSFCLIYILKPLVFMKTGLSSAFCSCCSATSSEYNEWLLTYNYSKRIQFATEIMGSKMTFGNLYNVLFFISTCNSS